MTNTNAAIMSKLESLASKVGKFIGIALSIFFSPALVMWGWEALAWEFNLPQFSYWAVFCICHGFRWLTENFKK